jgi:hypothetical protein
MANVIALWHNSEMNEEANRDSVTKREGWLRLVVPVLAVLYLGRSLFLYGATTYNIASTAFEIACLFGFWLIVTRISRPRRTYYLTALASLVIAAIFVGTPVAAGSSAIAGIIAWLGVSVLGAIWAAYYEKTEEDRPR